MPSIFTRGMMAAAALSACSLASAFDGVAIQSSAYIDKLSYTVQDLNALDGFNPYFTATTNPLQRQTTLTAGALIAPDHPPSIKFTALPFDSSSEIIQGPDFTAASKSGNNLGVKTNLMLPMLANIAQTATTSQIPATAGVSSSSLWTLGAYSQVTIQGTITSAINFDTAQLSTAGGPPQGAFVAETGYSSFFYTKDAEGTISYLDGSITGRMHAYWSPLEGGRSGGLGLADSNVPSVGLTRSFTLTASNNSMSTQDVYLIFSTSSQVKWWPTPDNLGVPEPATYVLMGLGLGLMAWRVRTARRA